jgi:hypothetical protein
MGRISGFLLWAVVLASWTVPAVAANFSFTGNFTDDNDVLLVSFDLLADATVTLETFGYGGGTNADGTNILPGGFESILQVFSNPSGVAVGGPILPGPDPTCAPRNQDPGRLNFCQDAYAQVFLTAGNYLLALTQNANTPNGNLSDGFFYDADPNFNSGFVGTFGFPGTSQWALDIVGVDSAVAPLATPEPGSAMLVASAFLLVGLGVRRRIR